MKHDYYTRTVYETRDSKAVNLIDRETDLCVAGYHIDYASHSVDLAYCTKSGRSKLQTFKSFYAMFDFISLHYESMRFSFVDRK